MCLPQRHEGHKEAVVVFFIFLVSFEALWDKFSLVDNPKQLLTFAT